MFFFQFLFSHRAYGDATVVDVARTAAHRSVDGLDGVALGPRRPARRCFVAARLADAMVVDGSLRPAENPAAAGWQVTGSGVAIAVRAVLQFA